MQKSCEWKLEVLTYDALFGRSSFPPKMKNFFSCSSMKEK